MSEPLILAHWEIRPRDGGPPIHGDLRAPRGPTPHTAIVVCHGFKGFKDWGFFPVLSRALARRGHAVLSFNFSHNGVGGDGVDFSALELFAEQTHTRNVAEIRAVLDAVYGGGLFPRAPRRVGLFGHSRGGAECVLAASADTRVHALVTWAAVATMERWSDAEVAAWERGERVMVRNARTDQEMPVAPSYWQDLQENRERLDVLRAAPSVEAPWLIVHGDRDETVDVAEGRQLFVAAAESAELLVIEGAGHTFGATHPIGTPTDELRTAADATFRWFENHLA